MPTGSGRVDFGIFDWLDDNGRGLADAMEHRLRLLEYADRAPFFAFHLAEHHGTPLGQAPSPNLFLAAAAARTSRIRLGALVNVLPLYDPVRLVEEVCMLDHLSRGRLELGIGRGGAPAEFALYDIPPAEARERYIEVADILLAGLRTGRVDFEGKFHTRRGITVSVRPVQQPYPPLWYPTSNPESLPWIGAQGLSTLFAFLLARAGADPADMVRRYERALVEGLGNQDRLNGHVAHPHYGQIRHVYVAGTDATARAEARPALDRFFDSFNRVWLAAQGKPYFDYDFDSFIGARHLLAGSPETVARQLREMFAATGGNYFVGVFAFGDLSPERSLRSLDLFTRQVIPALAAG